MGRASTLSNSNAMQNDSLSGSLDVSKPNEQGFKCIFCNQRFQKLTALKSHELVHTGFFCLLGERNHSCIICGKAFTRRHDMLRHQRTVHKSEMALECATCGLIFESYPQLTKHCSDHNHAPIDPFSKVDQLSKRSSFVSSSKNIVSSRRSSTNQSTFHPYSLSKTNSHQNSQFSQMSDYMIQFNKNESTGGSLNDFINFGNRSAEPQPSIDLPLLAKGDEPDFFRSSPELGRHSVSGDSYPIAGINSISAPDLLTTSSMDRPRYSHGMLGYQYQTPQLQDFLAQMNHSSIPQIPAAGLYGPSTMIQPSQPISDSTFSNSIRSMDFDPTVPQQRNVSTTDFLHMNHNNKATAGTENTFNPYPTRSSQLDILSKFGMLGDPPGIRESITAVDLLKNLEMTELQSSYTPSPSDMDLLKGLNMNDTAMGCTPSQTDISLYLASQGLEDKEQPAQPDIVEYLTNNGLQDDRGQDFSSPTDIDRYLDGSQSPNH